MPRELAECDGNNASSDLALRPHRLKSSSFRERLLSLSLPSVSVTSRSRACFQVLYPMVIGGNASVRIQRMPCAAFSVQPEVMVDPDRQLTERLSQSLSSRFQPSPAQKHWSFPNWAFYVTAGQDKFVVSIHKSKVRQHHWILRIHPGAPRVVLALLRQQTAEHVFAELFAICREIHALLAATPGVLDRYWGFSKTGPSVWTPDQLFEIKYKQEGWTGP
jgi:hypothetical protein